MMSADPACALDELPQEEHQIDSALRSALEHALAEGIRSGCYPSDATMAEMMGALGIWASDGQAI